MARRLIMALSVVVFVRANVPAMAGGCKGCNKIAEGKDGFCCGKGSAFGVKLTSQKLYEALKGKEIKPEQAKNCPCADCKTALKTNGKCDRCKVAGGKMYASPVSYALAKGAPMSVKPIESSTRISSRYM